MIPSAKEIEEKIKSSTLTWLARQTPDFWLDSTERYLGYESELLPRFRLGPFKDHSISIIKTILSFKSFTFDAFTASIVKDTGYPLYRVKITLNNKAEWLDVIMSARVFAGYPKRLPISANAKKLIDWAATIPQGQSAEFDLDDFNDDEMRNGEIMEAVMRAQKEDPRLHCIKQPNYGLTVSLSPTPLSLLTAEPIVNINIPVYSTEKLTKKKINEVVKLLSELVLSLTDRNDAEDIVLLRSSSRFKVIDFFKFKNPSLIDVDDLHEYLRLIDLPGMVLYWQISEGLGPWLVCLRTVECLTWDKVRSVILQKRKIRPSAEMYGLSGDAGAVLDWLLSLRRELFDHGLSPVIQDHLQTGIGITPPWEGENWNLFFDLICEEIREKTPYKTKAYLWHSGTESVTRIRFTQSPTLSAP